MSSRTRPASAKGFTLIELLIVIGIIGILAGIILVAVDPAKRLRQSRDARRSGEVYSILNAILNYTADNRGTLPAAIASATSGEPMIIGTATSGCNDLPACPWAVNSATTSPACADLALNLVDEYIAEMPVDPRGSHATTGYTYSATATGYYVMKTANGRIEVGSCNSEESSTIKVKR